VGERISYEWKAWLTQMSEVNAAALWKERESYSYGFQRMNKSEISTDQVIDPFSNV